MAGHIKLDRKIIQWEWYQDANTCRLFIHLLLMANYKESRWQGRIINRGQVIIGTEKLAIILKLGRQEIRTSLNKLKLTNEITITVTNKYSIITICKYDVYQNRYDKSDQHIDQQNVRPATNERPTKGQQTTTNNTLNNKEEVNKKKFITYPLPEHFNGLTETQNGSAVELVRLTKYATLTNKQVSEFWEAFKIQNLTGKKYYADEDEVYSHFLNWIKKQDFKNGTNIKSTTRIAKSAGAEQLLADIKSQVAAGRTKNT